MGTVQSSTSIDPLVAYQIYSSLKLHFTRDKYDYATYGLNKRTFSLDSLRRRNDRYFFERLATEFPDKMDLEYACAATFVHKPDVWVDQILTDQTWYNEHRRYIGNPLYSFKRDISALLQRAEPKALLIPTLTKTPLLYRLLTSSEFSIQTLTLLERTITIVSYYERFYSSKSPLMFDIIQPQLMRVKKLTPFVHIDTSDTVEEMKAYAVDSFKCQN